MKYTYYFPEVSGDVEIKISEIPIVSSVYSGGLDVFVLVFEASSQVHGYFKSSNSEADFKTRIFRLKESSLILNKQTFDDEVRKNILRIQNYYQQK